MVAEKALEAAKLGDLELLESLNVSRCLSEQVADSVGATCVHYAARAGNLDVLEYLITQCGFRGNRRSKIGATAAHDAAATGNLDCMEFMLDFLKTGCQVDDSDSTGATVLHLASRFGHYSVVRWILENTECNAVRKTAVGALPIHFAAARGDMRIIQLLVRQAPRTVNMQMSNGVTATYLACQEGHLDVLKYLVLQAGASLKIPAHDGMTCIHSAAQSGHTNVVSYLVTDQNCDPNERDFEGTTPIHFAASRGHTKVLKWLLLNGGKILLDNLGGSPLHDAGEHGQLESITVLLEHGCDPTIADNNGLTAEELADHCLHRECAILIKQFRPSEPNGHTYSGYNTNQNNGNGYINGNHSNGRMDYDDDEPESCAPSTVVVEVEVHRTNSGAAPAKRQCLSAETGETTNCNQGSQRPNSLPPSVVMSDTHSDISSTTSTMSTLSYPEREHEHMQRHADSHRNSYPAHNDENRAPVSPSQLVPPTSQRNRSVLARFPQNQENGESGHGAHWSEQRNQEIHHSYDASSPAVTPNRGSTFEDQIRQQSLKLQQNKAANGVDVTDDVNSRPPPPPMPPPPPPSQAPPAPPVPAIGSVKENIAKSKPYQFAEPRASPPQSKTNSMQAPLKARPNRLEKEREKAKADNIIAELKSVNMVASLRKVRKDPNAVVYDSSKGKAKTPTSPAGTPGSPVVSCHLTPDMPFESFLAEIGDKDQRGNEVPAWRKQLLARQLMEKTKKEYEQKQKVEEEESRLKSMPQWKRDMLQRKKVEQGENGAVGQDGETTPEAKSVPGTPTVDDDGKPIPPWKQEFMQRRKSKSLEPLNNA